MPNRAVGVEADEPAKQLVVAEVLQPQQLLADPVEGLQQRGQQQLLGRHRWPAFCGVKLTKGGIETIEGLIRRSG
jgi:hypothetical protein